MCINFVEIINKDIIQSFGMFIAHKVIISMFAGIFMWLKGRNAFRIKLQKKYYECMNS